MDDYSIVRDDYFYIKQQAFKHIESVARTTSSHEIREEESGKIEEEITRHKTAERTCEIRDLRCPFDHADLKTVSVEHVCIDYCPECYGIWLDMGELELLLNRTLDIKGRFAEIFKHELNPRDSVSADCPVCKIQMAVHNHYYENLKSHGCENCGGIWLDSGEFAAMYMERKHDRSASELLSEAVGKHINMLM